jgi:outer membrane usher protein FimD/PapC
MKILSLALIVLFVMLLSMLVLGNEDQEKKSLFEELLVSLKINYVETGIISNALRTPRNDILVPLQDLSSFNLKQNYLERAIVTIDNINYANLSSLPLINYKLNYDILELEINFPPEAMPVQDINIWQHDNPVLESYRGEQVSALFLNYDVTFSEHKGQFYVLGVQELDYSSSLGSFSQSFYAKQDFFGKNKHHIVRLDTYWISDNEAKIAQLKIGDSITTSADWSSTTRFAGIQYATDFSLKPNLVTYPLVDFSGRADLPSALDIYANSRLIYRSDLNIGDFKVDDLPVAAGRGALEVKQKDLTGKIQTISIPYYISPNLLKTGLSHYSFEVGTQRLHYSSANNKYRYLISSFDYNQGITDIWTSGVHFESMKNVFAVGTTNLYQIGHFGVVSASVATSGPKLAKAQKLLLGYSFNGEDFDFGLQSSLAGKGFINTFNLDNSGTKKSYQASASYILNDKSSIGLNYLSATVYSRQNTNKISMLSANYQNNLTRDSSLRLSVGKDFKRKDSAYIMLSFSANLGAHYASANLSKQGKDISAQYFIASTAQKDNAINYKASFIKNKKWAYDTQLMHSGKAVNSTAFLFDYGDGLVKQLELRGSVTRSEGATFFSRTVNESFAIVKLDKLKGVDVYHNNQIVAKTDSNGRAFVPNVIPYVDTRISLDESTLPMSAQFMDVTTIVNPRRKYGVIAKFDIRQTTVGEMVLVDENGTHLAQDTDVKIDGIDDELFVGYDGKLYIQDLKDLKRLQGTACKDDHCCHFEASFEEEERLDIIDLGVKTCAK